MQTDDVMALAATYLERLQARLPELLREDMERQDRHILPLYWLDAEDFAYEVLGAVVDALRLANPHRGPDREELAARLAALLEEGCAC